MQMAWYNRTKFLLLAMSLALALGQTGEVRADGAEDLKAACSKAQPSLSPGTCKTAVDKVCGELPKGWEDIDKAFTELGSTGSISSTLLGDLGGMFKLFGSGSTANLTGGTAATKRAELKKKMKETGDTCGSLVEKACKSDPNKAATDELGNACKVNSKKAGEEQAKQEAAAKQMNGNGMDMGKMAQLLGAAAPLAAAMMAKKDQGDNSDSGISGASAKAPAPPEKQQFGAPKPLTGGNAPVGVASHMPPPSTNFGGSGYGGFGSDKAKLAPADAHKPGNISSAAADHGPAGGGGGSNSLGGGNTGGASTYGGADSKKEELSPFEVSIGGGGRGFGGGGTAGAKGFTDLDGEQGAKDPIKEVLTEADANLRMPASDQAATMDLSKEETIFKVVRFKLAELKRRGNI